MTKLKDEVLILMSTYNGEKYIKEQIESIEKQVLDIPLNILVRDDGSKDNTIKILNELNNKYNNIKILEGENVGCNESFFKLFQYASGYKYYAVSDQDDIWLDHKIVRGIEKIKKEDQSIPILYGSCSYLMDNEYNIKGTTQKVIRNISLNNTIIQNFVPGHSEIFNDALLQLLKTNLDYKRIYVYDYWITNVAMVYGKIIFENEPSTKYRIHNSNTVGYGKSKFQWVKERLKRFKKGDGSTITSQIKYFYEINKDNISNDYKKEIEKFISSNNNFFKRCGFVFKTKLYRQKKLETFLFKIAYLFGKYKNGQ